MDVLVFRHPAMLETGDRVAPGIGDSGGAGGLTATEPAFLYWVDYPHPGARFGHPTLLVRGQPG